MAPAFQPAVTAAEFTGEEVLGAQVADAQAEDGQLVQAGGDLLGERQQAGQPLQLSVQPVPVPLGRVGLGPLGRRLLRPGGRDRERTEVSKQGAGAGRGVAAPSVGAKSGKFLGRSNKIWDYDILPVQH